MAIIIINGSPMLDTNVNYAGHVLPRDKVDYVAPDFEYYNNPSLVILGGITLPADTVININCDKIIAADKIIDGVEVYTNISRKAAEVDFEGVIRDKDQNQKYVFPQDMVSSIWDSVFLPNTVISLQNTYLNKIGIQELVIKSFSPSTVRGSRNVPYRMKCFENVPGSSIIIP